MENFYGVVQKVNFDGQEGVSQSDVDSDGREAELKLFRWLIFTYYNQSSKHYQS